MIPNFRLHEGSGSLVLVQLAKVEGRNLAQSFHRNLTKHPRIAWVLAG